MLYQKEDFKTSEKKNNEIPLADTHEDYEFDTGNTVLNESFNESFNDFMGTKSKYISNNRHYMYTNKNNFCSGYFPDFITLDNDIGYSISEGNNYSHYYLYTKNNSYLKPLSNPMSKYNNKYFDDMNFAYKICKKHSWVDETQRNTNLFRNSYFYKKHRLQTLRDTRIGIPEDMNKTYSSEESRIGNQRGSKGIKENEMIETTSWNSRIGVPIGTHTSEDSRIGIQRGSEGIGKEELIEPNLWDSRIGAPISIHTSEDSRIGIQRGSKHTQYINPTYYNKQNHLLNSQTHNLNSYHGSCSDHNCKEGSYYHDHPQYSKNKYNNKYYQENECSNQYHYEYYNYDQDGNHGRESGYYDQNSNKNKTNQRSKPVHSEQYLDNYKPYKTNQFHDKDFNHIEYCKPIQYSNPHHYDEANKTQNHSNHCDHIYGCSCKKDQYNYDIPQYCQKKRQKLHENTKYKKNSNQQKPLHVSNNSSSHKGGHRCKSGHPDQYLDKCKPGQHDQYLNGGYVQKRKNTTNKIQDNKKHNNHQKV